MGKCRELNSNIVTMFES